MARKIARAGARITREAVSILVSSDDVAMMLH